MGEVTESLSRSCDYTIKILTVGNSGVGKSSLLSRFVDGIFSSLVDPTSGMQPKWKIVRRGDLSVKLELWVHSQ